MEADLETLAKMVADFVAAMAIRERQVAQQLQEIREDLDFIKGALRWTETEPSQKRTQ